MPPTKTVTRALLLKALIILSLSNFAINSASDLDVVSVTKHGICRNCIWFKGHVYQYQWCTMAYDNSQWAYCSTRQGYTATDKKCRPNHACDLHGYPFLWCYVEGGGWDYCSKVVNRTSTKLEIGDEEENCESGCPGELNIRSYDVFQYGVAVDYKYNQTKLDNGAFVMSSPGCPKSVQGYPWVWHGRGRSQRCYLAGEEGPCGEDKKIFIYPESMYGFCNCRWFDDGHITLFDYEKIQFATNPWTKLEVVYLPRSKNCFSLFEQGPCKRNEWLVRTQGSNDNVNCEKRTCPERFIPVSYMETHNITISQTRTPNNDDNYDYDDVNDKYGISCGVPRDPRWYMSLSKSIPLVKCKLNNELYSRTLRRCVKKVRSALIGK